MEIIAVLYQDINPEISPYRLNKITKTIHQVTQPRNSTRR